MNESNKKVMEIKAKKKLLAELFFIFN